MLVHLIADFGANDLAFAEVTQAVMTHLPAAHVVATSVGPFDTLAAGFMAAQLAAAPAPSGSLMLLNVAPRRDDTRPRVDNDGERLLVAEMPGVESAMVTLTAEVARTVRSSMRVRLNVIWSSAALMRLRTSMSSLSTARRASSSSIRAVSRRLRSASRPER